MLTNTDKPRRELLPGVVVKTADMPKRVVCTGGLHPLFGDEFEVLGIIPACTKYTAQGNLWTCDTYYLRDVIDGGCYVDSVKSYTPC